MHVIRSCANVSSCRYTALITMNTTVFILGKMFEDFDVVWYRAPEDQEEGKAPVSSELHHLNMYGDEPLSLKLPASDNAETDTANTAANDQSEANEKEQITETNSQTALESASNEEPAPSKATEPAPAEEQI